MYASIARNLLIKKIILWRVKRSALQLRLTGSVEQPMSCYILLTEEDIGSNYILLVCISLLASTTSLAEAGTATICCVTNKNYTHGNCDLSVKNVKKNLKGYQTLRDIYAPAAFATSVMLNSNHTIRKKLMHANQQPKKSPNRGQKSA